MGSREGIAPARPGSAAPRRPRPPRDVGGPLLGTPGGEAGSRPAPCPLPRRPEACTPPPRARRRPPRPAAAWPSGARGRPATGASAGRAASSRSATSPVAAARAASTLAASSRTSPASSGSISTSSVASRSRGLTTCASVTAGSATPSRAHSDAVACSSSLHARRLVGRERHFVHGRQRRGERRHQVARCAGRLLDRRFHGVLEQREDPRGRRAHPLGVGPRLPDGFPHRRLVSRSSGAKPCRACRRTATRRRSSMSTWNGSSDWSVIVCSRGNRVRVGPSWESRRVFSASEPSTRFLSESITAPGMSSRSLRSTTAPSSTAARGIP